MIDMFIFILIVCAIGLVIGVAILGIILIIKLIEVLNEQKLWLLVYSFIATSATLWVVVDIANMLIEGQG